MSNYAIDKAKLATKNESFMKLIITGASGNIGRMIVPLLVERGTQLVLLGRDKQSLEAIFPGHNIATYSELPKIANDFDGILHLAVLNNDKNATLSEFKKANIEFLEKTIAATDGATLKFFLYPTSLHSSDDESADSYSKTKQLAEQTLRNATTLPVHIMRLPAVYGDTYSGKLAIINKFPTLLQGPLFKILASLKPTVSIHIVADAVMKGNGNKSEFLLTDMQKGNWFYGFMVKMLDLSFALFVVIALWWVILICIITARITSNASGIFTQTRVGQFGKHFVCYKIRTMKSGTAQRATHNITSESITKFGHFLRKSKLDELPQVINILKGEMSLIGPRPCLPTQTELVNARMENGVLEQKPGITGWSQSLGIDMSDPVRLAKSDKYFIDMQTIPMLLKILLNTFRQSALKDHISK